MVSNRVTTVAAVVVSARLGIGSLRIRGDVGVRSARRRRDGIGCALEEPIERGSLAIDVVRRAVWGFTHGTDSPPSHL
jgi:hypothetical protein